MARRAAARASLVAKAVKDLSDLHGLQGAAARLGVSPSTVSKWRRVTTGNVSLADIASRPRTVARWERRLEAANPRYISLEIERQYSTRDIADVLEVSPSAARRRLERLYKQAAEEPAETMIKAAALEKRLEEEGYRVVEGLRIYKKTSKLIPGRYQYKKTFFEEDDAIKWSNMIAGGAKYTFAVEERGKYALYIDFDEISPAPKKERARFARQAARVRWGESVERAARQKIRKYKRRKGR
jgi:predicted transcriptional regulator